VQQLNPHENDPEKIADVARANRNQEILSVTTERARPKLLASLGKTTSPAPAVPAFTRGARRLNGVLSGWHDSTVSKIRYDNLLLLGSVYRQCLVGMRSVWLIITYTAKINGRESPCYIFIL